MKNAKKIWNIGQIIMVLGSILYVVELLTMETPAFTMGITAVYAVSLVLMLIGWIGTKDERRAAKEAAKAEEEAA